MKRFFLVLAGFAALVLCVLPVHAGDAVSLKIGDANVAIAVPDGYVRLSEKGPSAFAISAAALPPSTRLAEALMAEKDLKGMLAGVMPAQPYLQVQVMRDAEALDFSDADWKALQPELARQMGSLDLDRIAKGMQSGSNERMSRAAGVAMEMKIGEIGKPHVYAIDGGVIRYALRMPVSTNVAGEPAQAIINCAGAAIVLNGKLVMLNAYLREQNAQTDAARVKAFLADAVVAAQGLNRVGVAPE